ncbi:MAG: hypothetical protein ACREYC_24060 [Gammaproteobacteria bacterium]
MLRERRTSRVGSRKCAGRRGPGGLEIEPLERAELALQAAELAPADLREEDVGGKPSKVHP